MKFTDDEIYRAAHTDIKDFLEKHGEKVKRSGTEWLWERHNSVKFRGHVWYRYSTGDKGTAIDFLQYFYNMSFPDAVITLLDGKYGNIDTTVTNQYKPPVKTHKEFFLPSKNSNMKRVYAYLCGYRCIDKDILSVFARKGLIYESADNHNAVFVGKNENGKAVYAAVKGTLTYKKYTGEVRGSQKEYAFNYTGTSGNLYVFEAAIDLLSYISLYMKNIDWQNENYIALGCLSDTALKRYLKDNKHIRKLNICLDNDFNAKKKDGTSDENHGQIAALNFYKKYTELGYDAEIYIPKLKDWNEDLQSIRKKDK